MSEDFEKSVDKILEELKRVLIKKHKDYGSANILESGLVGVLVRTNDKMSRIKNLSGFGLDWKEKEALNETIEDNWLDLANYAIINLMLRKNIFK